MAEQGRYHGGLVIFGYDQEMLERFSRIAAATMEDYGHPVERNTLLDDKTARVTATHYAIKISISQGAAQTESDVPDAIGGIRPRRVRPTENHWRVELDMYAANPARDDRDISELLLVVMLYRMAGEYDTTLIEWLAPETTMTADQFFKAFASISPDLLEASQAKNDVNSPRFAPVHETERRLSDQIGKRRMSKAHLFPDLNKEGAIGIDPSHSEAALTDEDSQTSDVQRLGIWAMTGTMVFLSAPVAASMAAVNLVKGEDLRLNTHVLALTGLLVTLQSSGFLANAVSRLPI